MSEKKQNVPKIRFPGFTEPWEKRKLGEVAKFSKGSGYTKSDLIESGTPIILYGRLYTKYETVINDVETFVRMNNKAVISEGNEVVVPASGETAEDISRASVIGKSGFILGGDLNIIKLNQEIDSIFLALTLSNGTQKKEMSKRAQGKSVVHLHNSDLKQVNLLYPKLEEQQQIGKFFLEIDNLITLHQRKLNNVQNLKAGLLQKMFPKDGEKVPEIRFPGFTDDWEQRKLGDVVDVRNGRDYKHLSEGEIPVYGTGGYMLSVNEALSDKEDAVGIGRKGTIDKPYILRAPFWTVDTLFYAIPKNDNNLEFLYDIFQDINWKQKDESTGVPSLSKTTINNVNVMIPESREQKVVGDFFSSIDNLITLYQRKLEHLQKQKKALLQQMFV